MQGPAKYLVQANSAASSESSELGRHSQDNVVEVQIINSNNVSVDVDEDWEYILEIRAIMVLMRQKACWVSKFSFR